VALSGPASCLSARSPGSRHDHRDCRNLNARPVGRADTGGIGFLALASATAASSGCCYCGGRPRRPRPGLPVTVRRRRLSHGRRLAAGRAAARRLATAGRLGGAWRAQILAAAAQMRSTARMDLGSMLARILRASGAADSDTGSPGPSFKSPRLSLSYLERGSYYRDDAGVMPSPS
jgi:hypothetical protein